MSATRMSTLAAEVLLESWMRELRARNLAPKTLVGYRESVEQLMASAAAHDLDPLSREAITTYLGGLAERYKPATVSVRYRALRGFFKWLAEEEEIAADPMASLKAPKVPEQPVPLLTDEEVRALMATCKGRDFVARRDAAILALFADTGMRLAELTRLKISDLDLDQNVALVLGKGRRYRSVPFGRSTAATLDRYLRVRARQPLAGSDSLWLGERNRGSMTESGVARVVRRRGHQAGLELHPHALRHQFAHTFKRAGGSDMDLMRLAGWRTTDMLARYGSAAADERAHLAYRNGLSPLDRLESR